MKILSPAGNFECLKVAVFNGADEVYLGVNEFNARNNIDGFNMETLKDAVDYAHLFGVKVSLAVNILFSDKELQSALDLIVDAYNLGVDSFIIQDLGLMSLLYENYPQIELHASTQMGLHNLEGVLEVLKFGVKRVVLARETPLAEVKRIKENTNVEIEYFVHGALCVSFSGNCYLSSYLFDASGNRGRCKQLCRLPYTLLDNGKAVKNGYLLSAKDFDMSKRLKDLKDAGVDVLKIEGRARRPYYVATATRSYKRALNGCSVNYDELELAFNRNYTEGYFNGNGKIISDIQNHIGIKIGKVERVNNGKNFNEVFISSNRVLTPKSTFKMFSNGVEKNTLTAYDLTKVTNGKYRLTTTQKVNVGDVVHLISDANKELEVLAQSLKRKVELNLEFNENAPMTANFTVGEKTYLVKGDECSLALKQPLSIEEIMQNFSKSDYFIAKLNVVNLGKVFVPKQKLNEFRRNVFRHLYERITYIDREKLEKMTIKVSNTINSFSNFAFVEDLKILPDAKNVIYSPETYSLQDVLTLKGVCDAKDKKLYLDTPYFALEKDIKHLKNIVKESGVGVVANNYYALNITGNVVIGAGLNVYNKHTAKTHAKPVITAESNVAERINAPYMTLRHCPIKSHLGGDCNNCKYTHDIAYKMDSGKVLKLKRKKLSDCTFYLTD